MKYTLAFSSGLFINCSVATVELLVLENGGASSRLGMMKAVAKSVLNVDQFWREWSF